MAYGVTSTGFVLKPLSVIKAEIEATIKATLGADANVSSGAVLGIIIGIFAAVVASVWLLGQAIYAAMYPATATGASLENICELTGVTKLPATESTTTLSLNLDDATTVPIGSIVRVGAAGNRFVTTAAAANALGYPSNVSVAAESEDTGPVVGNALTINSIVTPVSGWSAAAAIDAGSSEPYALSDGETLTMKMDDGSVQTATFETADFVAIGAALAAEVAVVIAADITGASSVDANGKPRIESTTDGPGSSVEVTGGTANAALGFSTTKVEGMNAADATLGTNIETDAALRLRRAQLLRAIGAGSVEAIRADVLDVTGVTACKVYENTTMTTDGDGVPAKAFEVVVSGGTDLAIAEAIWAAKPAGIEAHGTTSQAITDSQGISHTMKFSRPAAVDIHVDITVTTDSNYPSDGDTQIKAAIVLFGGTEYGSEDDVIHERVKCVAFDISGVTDITAFTTGTVDPPLGVINIVIGRAQIASFDTADIDVSSP